MDLCRQCNAPKSSTHYGVKISNFEKNPLEILIKIFKISYTGGYRFIRGHYLQELFFGYFGNEKKNGDSRQIPFENIAKTPKMPKIGRYHCIEATPKS